MANGEDKLYIRAFRDIRTYIIKNHLQPGDLLPPEIRLSEMLGVSRNVLREAIKSMELMGLVESTPGRGTVIKSFNLDFVFQNMLFFDFGVEEEQAVRNMFSVRRNLELSYAPQAFMGITREDTAHMRVCADRIAELWSRHKLFGEVDQDFHMTLYRSLNNQVLNSILRSIWAAESGFEVEMKSIHLDHTIAKHFAIVEAIEKRDYEGYIRAMQNHFSSGKYMSSGSYEEY